MWMEIFLGFVALFLALYFYVTKNFNRYKELGVPYEKGVFPFGSYDFIFGGHFDIQTATEKIHNKHFEGSCELLSLNLFLMLTSCK